MVTQFRRARRRAAARQVRYIATLHDQSLPRAKTTCCVRFLLHVPLPERLGSSPLWRDEGADEVGAANEQARLESSYPSWRVHRSTKRGLSGILWSRRQIACGQILALLEGM